MHGSAKYQVKTLFHLSGIDGINKKKFKVKQRLLKQGKTMHLVGKELRVHSYNDKKNKLDVWKRLLEFAKSNIFKNVHGRDIRIFDIEKITPYRVYLFLMFQLLTEFGVDKKQREKGTLLNYCSRAEKLEVALNMYAEKFNKQKRYAFSAKIAKARQYIIDTFQFNGEYNNREYFNPLEFIDVLQNKKYRIAALLQMIAGARASEVCHIRQANMLKNGNILLTNTKGGNKREAKIQDSLIGRRVNVTDNLYQLIQEEIDRKGIFKIDYHSYYNALKKTCEDVGVEFKGTHGLRWVFANWEFQELGKLSFDENGKIVTTSILTADIRKLLVSRSMGHFRPSITSNYFGTKKYVRKSIQQNPYLLDFFTKQKTGD